MLSPTKIFEKLQIDFDSEAKTKYGTLFYGCECAALCPTNPQGDEVTFCEEPNNFYNYHYRNSSIVAELL